MKDWTQGFFFVYRTLYMYPSQGRSEKLGVHGGRSPMDDTSLAFSFLKRALLRPGKVAPLAPPPFNEEIAIIDSFQASKQKVAESNYSTKDLKQHSPCS